MGISSRPDFEQSRTTRDVLILDTSAASYQPGDPAGR